MVLMSLTVLVGFCFVLILNFVLWFLVAWSKVLMGIFGACALLLGCLGFFASFKLRHVLGLKGLIAEDYCMQYTGFLRASLKWFRRAVLALPLLCAVVILSGVLALMFTLL